MNRTIAALFLTLGATSLQAQPFSHTYPNQLSERSTMLQVLDDRIEGVRPWMQSASGRAMIEAADDLPPRARRWRWSTRGFDERTYTNDQYDELDDRAQRQLSFLGVSELVYYTGWSDDAPFIEFRAFDLAFHGSSLAEPSGLAGARVLLIDPTVITPAWALARLGANVTVVSSSQRFRAVYNAPSDRGTVRGLNGGPDGSVTIVDGNWPAQADELDLGEPFNLVVAVGILNTGRADPSPWQMRSAEPPEPRRPMGMPPAEAADHLAALLAPGGRAAIYNWGSPARPGRDLSPQGDVRLAVRPDHAQAAGLVASAFASDSSVFTRLLSSRTGDSELRRPLEPEGITAPQLSAVYAIYDKPHTADKPEN